LTLPWRLIGNPHDPDQDGYHFAYTNATDDKGNPKKCYEAVLSEQRMEDFKLKDEAEKSKKALRRRTEEGVTLVLFA
jgi:hypothetical protein